MLVQHCIKSYKCVVFTGCRYTRGVNLFRNTHSNTVSLFAKQGPAKIQDKWLWDSMELLLIDVAQVYMNLLWFENLLLMRLWVWNAYLVLLWNRALAYPRALLHYGGPLSREFWQLTIPLNNGYEYSVRLKVKTWSHRAIPPYTFYFYITINEQKLAEWLILVRKLKLKYNNPRKRELAGARILIKQFYTMLLYMKSSNLWFGITTQTY